MTTTFPEFQDDGITHTKMLKQRQNEYHFLGARVEEYHKLRGLQRSRQWTEAMMKPGTKQQEYAGVSGRQREDRLPEGIPSCRRKDTNNTFFARKFNPQAVRLYPPFSSVQLLTRVRLCDSMNCSTPGFPAHHQLPELTQTHVH